MRRFGLLGFGIWVLGFGIFAFAQEQRGSLGTIGALGQEVKRPPQRNEPAPRLPDGTVSLDGLWVGGRWLNGDQTHQGRHIQFHAGGWTVQRIKLYRYD